MAQVKNSRKPLAALVVGGLTLAGTGVAFAYWTATGVGEGTATTGVNATAFLITSDDAVGPALTPDGPSQTVAFTVTNPGTATLLLNTVTVRVALEDGAAWAPGGCSDADYDVDITTNPAPVQIPEDGSVSGVATISMINADRNQDGCQGLDVPLYFSTNTPPV